MIALVLAALLSILEGPGVCWVDAWELHERGLPDLAPGTYHVWVWVADAVPASVTINGHDLDISASDAPTGRFVWAKAGEIAIQESVLEVALSDNVAAMALSTEPDFDPAGVMGDMRVLDQPGRIHDQRAETVRHTSTVFTMPEFRSREAWEAYAEGLRRRILVSSGLWPLPEKTPLNTCAFGRIEHEDYTVEKVHFEARPGFLVTGNLYRPTGPGPFPAVVCPHGHWEKGRLENSDTGSVPARCITLARMGMIAFSYDMIGYNDSRQFPHNWGGAREKLWGIHPFAMQLWSSIRAVDMVEALPDVDPERIGCTGASGGGTQTFALTAVDERIKVAAPVNMISCSMQGGCLCENAPILRLDNSNMEIGALAAPRPLLMVSATGDWTRETPRVEYPAIRSIYRLYDAADRIASVQVRANHNYNQTSREAMYRFFGAWLLGDREKWLNFTEPDFQVEEDAALRVFPGEGPLEGYSDGEAVIASVIDENRARLDSSMPRNANDLAAFRAEFGPALEDALGAAVPDANDLACERFAYEERNGYVVERWILGRKSVGDKIPAILYRSSEADPQDAVLIVHGQGKAALADLAAGGPGPLVRGLIDAGKAVMAIDTFLVGEHHDPRALTERRRKGNFMDTFQPTNAACRVQDVLTALAYLRFRRDLTDTVSLVGLGQAGLWCLLAGAVDTGVGRAFVDIQGFDANDDAAWVASYYVPCIRSIGDVNTAGALTAPRPLWIANTRDIFNTAGMQAVYSAAGADTFRVSAGMARVDALLAFLR